MVAVYASLIEKGVKKIDNVPERIKEQVIEILVSHGFVWDEN